MSARLCVLVAALTYKRPADLRELLPKLIAQADSVDAECSVLIVDNDPDGGARDFVSKFVDSGVQYVHVRQPGIAAARNSALQLAQDFDLLVFIDDDERPVEGWLRLLLQTYRDHHSAAVVGPVVSEFAVIPEPWIAAGQFFNRRRHQTGTRVDLAATNNLLLDMRQIQDLGLCFDERFGLTGGSDSLFTRQIHAGGGEMVWCDEAVVFDMVPAQRLTRKWVLQRAFRNGNTWIRTCIEVAGSPQQRALTRVSLSARGVTRLLGGAGRFTFGALTGRLDRRVSGIRTMARGAGLVAGSFGSVYSEYRR